MSKIKKHISFVIPAFNESENIRPFYKSLISTLSIEYEYNFLFVNDGSTDSTHEELIKLRDEDARVSFLRFSRNFGKEAATSAGIHHSIGDAIIMIDADGQHPVEITNEMLRIWEAGAKTVVGVREEYESVSIVKKIGSSIFYKAFNLLTKQKLIPGSTDFRLIDKEVGKAFSKLTEHSRMTRALLDWLGYRQEYVHFKAKKRLHGDATYSTKKLLSLAFSSFISLSLFPIYISAYIGLIITPLSLIAGLFIITEQYILSDPLGLNITGSASLGILILFLVGIILLSQGILAVYISKIYSEVKARPLYVVDEESSGL